MRQLSKHSQQWAGAAPQRAILSSLRILTLNHLFQPPLHFHLFPPKLLYQFADDMAKIKHQPRNGKKARCIFLKISVYAKIKGKKSVKLRKFRGFHTPHAAAICFRLNPNIGHSKKTKQNLKNDRCVFNLKLPWPRWRSITQLNGEECVDTFWAFTLSWRAAAGPFQHDYLCKPSQQKASAVTKHDSRVHEWAALTSTSGGYLAAKWSYTSIQGFLLGWLVSTFSFFWFLTCF